ncbi:MAG: transcription-repair coupling factor [Bulleidia sp.]
MPVQLLDELKDNAALRQLNTGRGTLPLNSLIEEALILSASYLKNPRPILVVKNNLYSAQRLYERVSSLLPDGQCALFGSDESLRVEAIASSPEMMAGKVETLASLLDHSDQIVITSPSGLLRHLPLPAVFRGSCISLKPGDHADMEEIRKSLKAGGYFQTSHIDQPLSFAARGGIIDVYSINYDHPVRIEFFDDEIDSIRFFDESTQKTITPADHVEIVPASDILFTEDQVQEITEEAERLLKEKGDDELRGSVETDLELLKNGVIQAGMYPYTALLNQTASILDYMDHPLVIWSDRTAIEESTRRLIEETTSYIQEMVQEKKLLPRFSMWHDLHRVADGCRSMEEDPYYDNTSGISEIHLPNEPLDLKLKLLDDGSRVLFCLKEKEMPRLIDACIEYRHPYKLITDDSPLTEGFQILMNPLAEGFEISEKNLRVITASELFKIHHHTGRFEKKFRSAEVIHSYEELEPGDYIVHAQHGVGQYMGIETREIQGVKRDFLRVIYRGNAELLVPLEQFRLVRKFVSREGVVPKLNKLGSGEWEKTKERLEADVTDIAERLVSLYSSRETHIGYAYQPDTEEQKKFESEFQYELTPDQAKAVEDVKRDMESDKPMDRLICGDVGFGKTEIAVRAAFKAASENKQVAVLCPTTILAEQHYHTFSERFNGYPFTVRVLDRFVPPSMMKETLKDTREGRVDILIGTHRILSKDVQFKDLGLLVVDEEQRFGVEHKEKIKEMKNGIDVLTLSATPIPRTLQMSLVGIRSLSLLETPPDNRYNVQTYVVEKNRGLIVDAIEKELARNGQVFYLYNSIDTIYNTARTLQSLIPDARIGIVHGKMNREDIEDVMMQFTRHEINVLVCTTIIENGINIPNANTMIIENAQDFGLSQIYQIKGRVGRSDRVAYAYLLIPPRRQLSETASKRLQAVKEFARLGSGYKIAMRDLTIRGAGDLLGPDQSGFIDTVGIDMYIEMLEEAIEKKKGIVREEKQELRHAVIPETSYIPENFAPDDYDKISMYQKIDQISTMEQLEQYREEVTDQYGKLPSEVQSLFEKRRLDILVNDPSVDSCREVRGQTRITFSKLFSQQVDGVKLFQIFSNLNKDIALRYADNQISATLPKMKSSVSLAADVIMHAKEALRTNESR